MYLIGGSVFLGSKKYLQYPRDDDVCVDEALWAVFMFVTVQAHSDTWWSAELTAAVQDW